MQIAVIGLGLIGGSIAKALRPHVDKIIGVDINQSVINDALDSGAIDEGFLDSHPAISQADVSFICLYPSLSLEFITQNASFFKRDSIVTDVVGIKTPLMNLCNGLDSPFTYIGGHPMAGKETWGFENSNSDMFQNKNYIITPSAKATAAQIEIIKNLVRLMGFTNITCTTSDEHDRIIAYTSQFPHIIAVSMCDTPMLTEFRNFTGGSFEDVTRVANINENLWCELFLQNKNQLLEQISSFQNSISKFTNMLHANDEDGLKALLKSIRENKELIDHEKNNG